MIVKIIGGFIILGLLVAFFSRVEYSTGATLMPEMQQSQRTAGSLLQQYGGLLGFSGGTVTNQEGNIPPQLYPNIVQSLPYQLELMNTEVYFSEYDTTTTIHDFFINIYSPSILSYVKGYTIGLPGKLIGLFKAEEKDLESLPNSVARDSVIRLTKKQMETVDKLRERLTISVVQETGVLTLSAEFPDPRAAAEIAQAGISLLKKNVKEYRTEKARQNLEFIQGQVKEAKIRFEEVQQQLAEFRDSNVNIATAKAQSREQELQSQYDLAFELYNSLSQRLEQAKLNLQEETPVLSVLQPVSVPLEKSSPKRMMILIVSGILGAIFALCWVLLVDWWRHEKVRF